MEKHLAFIKQVNTSINEIGNLFEVIIEFENGTRISLEKENIEFIGSLKEGRLYKSDLNNLGIYYRPKLSIMEFMQGVVKVWTKEEIEANRSSAYQYVI